MIRRFLPFHGIRGRLLFLAIVVETVVLALSVANSVRVLEKSLTKQTQIYAGQLTPILNAALVAPLVQRDYATMGAILTESRVGRGLDYVAVIDLSGRLIAVSGWAPDKPLPTPDPALALTEKAGLYRYDVSSPILAGADAVGRLQFGLNLDYVLKARRALMIQNIAIAIAALVLSAGLFVWLGSILTRQFSRLAKASQRIADGEYHQPTLFEGDDEIGRLGAAFNTMSRAVRERVDELTLAMESKAHLAEALGEERSRLVALLSTMDFGVLFVDEKGEIVYANPAVAHLCDIASLSVGRSGLDLLQRTLLWQVNGDVREAVSAQGRILVQNRYPVQTNDGEPMGELVTIRDVTEDRLAAQQLTMAKDDAETANKAKSDFLATMSHEIRTPLNGIIGMTGLLLDLPLTHEQRRYAEIIRISGDALLAVINDVLDFSKMEAGHLKLEQAPFSLGDLIESVLEIAAPQTVGKGIALACYLDPAVDTRFIGDISRLRQVLLNLVSNAVKFTERGGVWVELVPDPARAGALLITVHDTGIGIPDEAMPRLFQTFSQVDASTARRFGGTGLGLAICRRLLTLMGGEIGVKSTVGRGSRFWCSIPLALAPEATPRSVDQALIGRRVLLLDDQTIAVRLLKQQIASWGMHVTVLDDVSQLSATVSAAAQSGSPFEILMTDEILPGQRTWRLLEDLRQTEGGSGLHILVMLSSVVTGPRDQRADHVIVKPVKPSALYEGLLACTVLRQGGEPALAPALAEANVPRLRILVAEDNIINQRVTQEILTRMGHRVDVVANGIEAVESIRRLPYDLVLMDIQMPEMDGIAATEIIRGLGGAFSRLPIIALTANALSGDAERCRACGMTDYLSKPIDRVRLGQVIAAICAEIDEPGQEAAGVGPSTAHALQAVHGARLDPGAAGDFLDLVLLTRLQDEEGDHRFQRACGYFKTVSDSLLQKTMEAARSNDGTAVKRALLQLRREAMIIGGFRLAHLAGTLRHEFDSATWPEKENRLCQCVELTAGHLSRFAARTIASEASPVP